jgi:type IV pilus assembly protein PilY1
MSNKSLYLAVVLVFGIAVASAHAQAIISSTDGVNTVFLGVNSLGHLNVDGGPAVNSGGVGVTGISYSGPSSGGLVVDATSPGCYCEGWGVSVNGTTSGFANRSSGTGGLSFVSAVHDDPGGPSVAAPHGSFITTSSTLIGNPGISITQAYSARVPGALFEDRVTISNTSGAAVTDVQYVRVMDWDVPFTEFAEMVSIVGTATTANLVFSNDQGFASADPLAPLPPAIVGGTTDADFVDSGPADHGAYFKFNFGSLADGESVSFSVFYGAAPTEAAMLAALGAASVELYSLGQSSPPDGDPAAGTPITYAFGFAGVGGVIVIPPDGAVPEPATAAVWGGLMSVAGVVAWRTRRKSALAA